ncbi:MAG: hypothetical protein HC911_13100 [Chloroflexaceae bacterium]|nr:hypothetical protein [Chloroflexaceae bacterium]
MTELPFRKIILYKHGVGYFERRGVVQGSRVRLSFPREAMDDVLKSLVVLDLGAGQVLSVDFETPEDRASLLKKGSIHLSDNHSMLDLLRDLRGRAVRCIVQADKGATRTVSGTLVGVDYEQAEPLKRALLSVYLPETRRVEQIALEDLLGLDLLDANVAADLEYFLRAAQSEAERRSATIHLSDDDHDLLVGYIAPAPAWRVSYRLLLETDADGASTVLLQGWGLFDNQLEEDLTQVQLTLVAGMPVSFRYRLYAPHTPERPLIEDEERTVHAPVMYEAPSRKRYAPRAAAFDADSFDADARVFSAPEPSFSAAELANTVQSAASGSERGALFAYEVTHPVSVARGQSAMVPILSASLPCRRELLYNGRKLAEHPVASVRLANATGLTLERGPITVLDDGAYAGEAVIPFTSIGSEVIVAYAVELGIRVSEQPHNERQIKGIQLREDYLLIEEYDTQQTTYTLTNTLPKAASVTLEHNCRSGYTLEMPNPPDERGAEYARWLVPCPADSLTDFTVTEQRLVSRREQIRSITGVQAQQYFKQGLFDAATHKRVKAVLALYHEIEVVQRQLKRLDKEREAIFKHQQQIQANLTPLGREGSEGALRERYVAELTQFEDQLAQLGATQKQHEAQIDTLEQRIQAELKS